MCAALPAFRVAVSLCVCARCTGLDVTSGGAATGPRARARTGFREGTRAWSRACVVAISTAPPLFQFRVLWVWMAEAQCAGCGLPLPTFVFQSVGDPIGACSGRAEWVRVGPALLHPASPCLLSVGVWLVTALVLLLGVAWAMLHRPQAAAPAMAPE